MAGPVIIAHRGASGYLPEHTLEAVVMAHAQGADFIEQDLVLSKDGIPVVLHDIHVDSISDAAQRFPGRQRADGRWYAIDFTLAELKQLNVHERRAARTGQQVYPKRFPGGTGRFSIPTLEEELQLIQGLNASTGRTAGIYPELKQPAWHRGEGQDLSRMVLPVLHRYGYRSKADPCWLQCFEMEEVTRLRRELGWAGRLLLLSGGPGAVPSGIYTEEGMTAAAAVADGVGPPLSAVITGGTPAARRITGFVTMAHARHLAVHPYTLRTDELPACAASPEEVLHAILTEAGADGLFTDFPDVAVRWRDREK